MNYGFFALIRLIINKLRTMLFFPGARLIRFPVYLRGKTHIRWGKGFTTGVGCRMESLAHESKITINIGASVQFNDYVHITGLESVTIGNNTLLASKIYISDTTHGSYKGDARDSDPAVPPQERTLITNPVEIGKNVWIGEGVSILPGVKIGDGSIIGANSVVTREIPAYCIAAGSPAKVLKLYNKTTRKWEKYND